jgi:alkylation response protein AidB-like acyl-CoA dehydrogenase
MDFEITYTPEQEGFRSEVRAWLEDNVPPELSSFADIHRVPLAQYLQQRELGRKLGAKGWLFPTASAEYGGGDLSLDQAMILAEEMDRFNLSLPPYYDSGGVLGAMSILVWGTAEQKAHFLPRIYRGEIRTWQLLTEPEAGSDLANVKSIAVRDGDDYLISGQKVFVGSEHGADYHWTLVSTDPAGQRHKNLSWFMIDANAPGITTQPMYLLGGTEKSAVFFDQVRVPAFNLIGGENNGWAVATTHLDMEHGFRSDRVFSLSAEKLWDALLEYCRTTERGGRRLIDDAGVRDQLARIYASKEVQRLWGLRNFWLATARQPRSYEGAQAYYNQKISAQWLTRAVVDIMGPFALTSDARWGPPGSVLKGQQALGVMATHGGGTADIQKVVMARRIGIGRTEREAAGALG